MWLYCIQQQVVRLHQALIGPCLFVGLQILGQKGAHQYDNLETVLYNITSVEPTFQTSAVLVAAYNMQLVVIHPQDYVCSSSLLPVVWW